MIRILARGYCSILTCGILVNVGSRDHGRRVRPPSLTKTLLWAGMTCTRLLDGVDLRPAYPGTAGMSGSWLRNLSRALLNTSTDTPCRFLKSVGSELYSLGPRTVKLPSLMVLIAAGHFVLTLGTWQYKPLLSLMWVVIGVDLRFGASLLRIFQVYIIEYLSQRRWME